MNIRNGSGLPDLLPVSDAKTWKDKYCFIIYLNEFRRKYNEMYEFLEKCIEKKIDDSIEVLQGKPKIKEYREFVKANILRCNFRRKCIYNKDFNEDLYILTNEKNIVTKNIGKSTDEKLNNIINKVKNIVSLKI